MGHAYSEALVETTVLALVPVLFLDFTVAHALVILQLQAYGPPEETLQGIYTGWAFKVLRMALLHLII